MENAVRASQNSRVGQGESAGSVALPNAGIEVDRIAVTHVGASDHENSRAPHGSIRFPSTKLSICAGPLSWSTQGSDHVHRVVSSIGRSLHLSVAAVIYFQPNWYHHKNAHHSVAYQDISRLIATRPNMLFSTVTRVLRSRSRSCSWVLVH
jgi:hypothetical protein